MLTEAQAAQVRASLTVLGVSLREWCTNQQRSYWRTCRMINRVEAVTPAYRTALAQLIRDGQERMTNTTTLVA